MFLSSFWGSFHAALLYALVTFLLWVCLWLLWVLLIALMCVASWLTLVVEGLLGYACA